MWAQQSPPPHVSCDGCTFGCSTCDDLLQVDVASMDSGQLQTHLAVGHNHMHFLHRTIVELPSRMARAAAGVAAAPAAPHNPSFQLELDASKARLTHAQDDLQKEKLRAIAFEKAVKAHNCASANSKTKSDVRDKELIRAQDGEANAKADLGSCQTELEKVKKQLVKATGELRWDTDVLIRARDGEANAKADLGSCQAELEKVKKQLVKARNELRWATGERDQLKSREVTDEVAILLDHANYAWHRYRLAVGIDTMNSGVPPDFGPLPPPAGDSKDARTPRSAKRAAHTAGTDTPTRSSKRWKTASQKTVDHTNSPNRTARTSLLAEMFPSEFEGGQDQPDDDDSDENDEPYEEDDDIEVDEDDDDTRVYEDDDDTRV